MYCNNYFIIIMATLYVNDNNNMVQTSNGKSTEENADGSSKLKTICVWAIQFIKLILVIGLGCIVKGNWTTI